MPTHSPSAGAVKTIRGADISALSVGEFKLAESKPEAIDKSITSRSQTLVPQEGSISGYLRSALVTELQTAGKYDEASKIQVSGELTESELNTNMGTADGTLGARFKVTGGKAEYDKVLSVKRTWESSFVGAIAIPKALQEYMGLYERLLKKLFTDPEFVTAAQ